MNGRMDLAVLYGGKAAVHGLYVPAAAQGAAVPGRAGTHAGAARARAAAHAVREMDLYLPRPYNVVRKLVDEAFVRRRAWCRAWWPRSNRPAR